MRMLLIGAVQFAVIGGVFFLLRDVLVPEFGVPAGLVVGGLGIGAAYLWDRHDKKTNYRGWSKSP